MSGRNVIIDIIALVVYVVAANPLLTGIDFHEWFSLAVCVIFFVHCLQHADWVLDAARHITSHFSWSRAGNLVLDALLLIVLMVVIVSGIMISGAVLPAFGLYAQGYYFWDPLHAVSAKVLLALLILHILVHGKAIVSWFKHVCCDHDKEAE